MVSGKIVRVRSENVDENLRRPANDGRLTLAEMRVVRSMYGSKCVQLIQMLIDGIFRNHCFTYRTA